MADALPFLVAAESVTVLVIDRTNATNTATIEDPTSPFACADMARTLTLTR